MARYLYANEFSSREHIFMYFFGEDIFYFRVLNSPVTRPRRDGPETMLRAPVREIKSLRT